MRSLLSVVLIPVAALSLALCACGDDTPPSSNANRGDLRVVLPGQDQPVRQGDYDFGAVTVGESRRVQLKVENVGDDLAHITSTRFEEAPAGTFFAQAPSDVEAGDSANLYVTFAPTAAGPVSGRMVIEHSGASASVSLNLTGVGQ